jgi:hypothetical protein
MRSKCLSLFVSLCAVAAIFVAGCAKGNSSNPVSVQPKNNSKVAIVVYAQGVPVVGDSIRKCVLMLYPKISDGIADSTISNITWQVVGDGMIGIPTLKPTQVMWRPDTGHYKIQVTLLQKDGNYFSNTRDLIIYESGAVYVAGDSILTLFYGAKTAAGLLPVTMRFSANLFVDPSVLPGYENPQVIDWGMGRPLDGKMIAVPAAGGIYRYVSDTLYPGTMYSVSTIVKWNGTKDNSIWTDTNKCVASKYWLPDAAGRKAFRFMTPPVDSVIPVDTSLMAGASGDTGSAWLMKIRIRGDTTTYFFNPALNANPTAIICSFVVNKVATNVQLVNGGAAYYAKLSRAQVQGYTSSDGVVHILYGGVNMNNSVFYLPATGDLGFNQSLLKRKA